MHPDDQMFRDVFGQDRGATNGGEQSLDGLLPLDCGNPGSPAVELPQGFEDFNLDMDVAFQSYSAQLDGLVSGLPNSWRPPPDQEPSAETRAQLGGDLALAPLDAMLDGSQGVTAGYEQSTGWPQGHAVPSNGPTEQPGTLPLSKPEASPGAKAKAGKEPAAAATQMAMMKERNRGAQKRYRDRLKGRLQETEDTVAGMTEELNALRIERASLANRNELLEKFLTMQQQQEVDAACEPADGLTDRHVWWLDDRTKRLVEDTVDLRGGQDLLLEYKEGSPVSLTQDQAANLTEEQFTELWQEYVSAAADCLLKANDDPESDAGKRLVKLTRQVGQLKSSMGMRAYNFQGTYQRLRGTAPEGILQRMTKAQCLELVKAAKFSEQQADVIIRMRTLYLHNLGALIKRRRQMAAMLQSADHGASHQQLLRLVQKASMHAVERLRETLRSEQSFTLQFMMTLWQRVMTPFQAARIGVTAYPMQVDVLAIVNTLAEERGEKSAAEVVLEGQQLADDALLVPIDTIDGIAAVGVAK